MDTTTQQTQNVTIIDLATAKLPPAKREAKIDGRRATTHHTLTTLQGVGLALGNANKFRYKGQTGGAPAHMHCFADGAVNVHLRDASIDLDAAIDGDHPLDVEICATIVRNTETGRVEDSNLYLNVRACSVPTGNPAPPKTIVSLRPMRNGQITSEYQGRKGAVMVSDTTARNNT